MRAQEKGRLGKVFSVSETKNDKLFMLSHGCPMKSTEPRKLNLHNYPHAGVGRMILTLFVASLSVARLSNASWPASICIATLACILVFTAINRYAGFFGNLYFKRGGKAQLEYSQEQSLAKSGEREKACQNLLDRHTQAPDPEALRVCLAIAIKLPVLNNFAMAACQGLLGDASVSAADKTEYQHILRDIAPDAAGAKHQIGSTI
jgi:hypothetical protein